jgi:hypothetical protein
VRRLSHWKALEKLLFHPHWCRLWIVQEIVFARDVRVLCSRR